MIRKLGGWNALTKKLPNIRRRAVVFGAFWLTALSAGTSFWVGHTQAGPLDSIVKDPQAQIFKEETFSLMPGNKKGLELPLDTRTLITLDIVVEPSTTQVLYQILTRRQNTEMMSGKTPTGTLMMNIVNQGRGTMSILLATGQYYLYITNSGSSTVTVSYRVNFRKV